MKYVKHIALAAAFSVVFAVSGAVAAPIAHVQTTLDWERIVSLASPGGPTITETLEFEITNATTEDWTDYHFRFFNPFAFFDPSVVTIANVVLTTNPFANFSIDANNQLIGAGPEREARLTLAGGIVPIGGVFGVKLDLTYNNSVDVDGRPTIPEPSVLLLTALGTSLMALRARRQRSGKSAPRS
jgi:hypothetical protein